MSCQLSCRPCHIAVAITPHQMTHPGQSTAAAASPDFSVCTFMLAFIAAGEQSQQVSRCCVKPMHCLVSMMNVLKV